ncbi:hypothetical protein B0T16DRAFT_462752 [Cercophora newfieldiana]|uniref:Uncharacterized protein n=1 Tax=Cercophora newfieldiana TaxID=92897 RepID=A0AA39XSN2_9PEZI|nr:hypothetical protein B0T16DRAFT_462752 [Cercophora newfieldiana]
MDEERLAKMNDHQAYMADLCKKNAYDLDVRLALHHDLALADKKEEETAISLRTQGQLQTRNVEYWFRWHATTVAQLFLPKSQRGWQMEGWAIKEVHANLVWLQENQPPSFAVGYSPEAQSLINKSLLNFAKGPGKVRKMPPLSTEEQEEMKQARAKSPRLIYSEEAANDLSFVISLSLTPEYLD